MTLTFDIDQHAQERLRRRAQSIGVPVEQAEREVIQAAKDPEASGWSVLGFILMLALLEKDTEFSAELGKAISTVFQPMVDRMLKHGTEEQLAALLPKMPVARARNQAGIDLMRQWREEDAALSPTEATEADQEFEEFKRNMNANRAATGEEPLF
jgi:hypothetical protein